MDQYLKNILPRIIQYSKDLSKIEVFVDKSWIYIDQKGNHHDYMFLRDSRFLMTLNGTVQTGKWELLPNGKLLIDRIIDTILLESMFIESALLILKISASNDDAFILINEKELPDLNVVKYLEGYLRKSINGSPSEIEINSDASLSQSIFITIGILIAILVLVFTFFGK